MAIGDLELPTLLLDLSKQPRVLDRQHRLGSEGLKEVNYLVCEKFPNFRASIPLDRR